MCMFNYHNLWQKILTAPTTTYKWENWTTNCWVSQNSCLSENGAEWKESKRNNHKFPFLCRWGKKHKGLDVLPTTHTHLKIQWDTFTTTSYQLALRPCHLHSHHHERRRELWPRDRSFAIYCLRKSPSVFRSWRQRLIFAVDVLAKLRCMV
jgi:hypothetical protein